MATLTAELVATGDELMSGAIADKNSALACGVLREHGVDVSRISVVGDDPERMLAVLQSAASRARFVIVGGGLGPTEDDRTAEVAARLAGVDIVHHDEALAVTERAFARIGREMTPNNRKQAQLPEGAKILDNPIGSAAGFRLKVSGTDLFFMPGVPREYEKMLRDQVVPVIDGVRERAGDTHAFRVRVVKLFGKGESAFATDLEGAELPEGVAIGWRPRFPEIHLRLYAQAGTPDALEQQLADAEAVIRSRVGKYVFGVDDDELPAVLGAALLEKKWTLAVAESCTGGLLGSLITQISGSSQWFERGYITYSNQAKMDLLGVDAQILETHGAVSEECARAMATGARERAGVDLALSVTGIAGPTGGTDAKPVGTVYVGAATAHDVMVRHLKLWGDRQMIRTVSAYSALEMARRLARAQ